MSKTVILDCHGGDNAPECVIKGADIAAKNTDIRFVFVGDEVKIKELLKDTSLSQDNYEIVHSDDVLTMEDDPTSILKSKSGSSMAIALKLLAQNKGDAVISAGNSGALLTGATLFVKRIKGVKRAAFSPLVPSQNNKFLLIDAGANVQCTPDMLLQFASLGNIYAKYVMNIDNPRIGLLNNGSENSKGTDLLIETNALLKQQNLNFVGNIEAGTALKDGCDVLVADGFSGNIFLKTLEATASLFSKSLKNIFYKNIKNVFAALLIKSDINSFKKKMSGDDEGGAPLLGISKPVFKAHGSSNAKTFAFAIKDAVSYVENDISTKLTDAFPQEN